jgi:hypothetical protein
MKIRGGVIRVMQLSLSCIFNTKRTVTFSCDLGNPMNAIYVQGNNANRERKLIIRQIAA